MNLVNKILVSDNNIWHHLAQGNAYSCYSSNQENVQILSDIDSENYSMSLLELI